MTEPKSTAPARRRRVGLTRRQGEVLDALVRLGSSKLVARELQIEKSTVDGIVRTACARLGVRTRLQAVLAWDRSRRPVQTAAPITQIPQTTQEA